MNIADHVAFPKIAASMGGSDLEVWAPEGVVGQLVEAGAPRERVHAAVEGETFEASGFEVRPLGHEHATIYPSMPTPVNHAYLIDGVALHPGDSFTPPPEGTRLELLFLPVSAPWLKLAESIDDLKAAAPRFAVPIHDAILSDPGRGARRPGGRISRRLRGVPPTRSRRVDQLPVGTRLRGRATHGRLARRGPSTSHESFRP